MLKTVEAIFRNGKIELLDPPPQTHDGRVLVSFLQTSGPVKLDERGIWRTGSPVRHHQQLCPRNRMAAKRRIPVGLRNVYPDTGFEPLAVVVDQGDDRDGRLANPGRKEGDVIK